MRIGVCGGSEVNSKFKRKFSKPVDNIADVEYNIDETKKVSVWRHVKAVLRLGRLITGTL